MSRQPVITIDGASGTGKGVVTHRIAKKLGWHLLDSGVLYRVLALAAETHRVSLEDEPALTILATNLDVKFLAPTTSDPPQIWFEDENITDLIRTETIGNSASKVGALLGVRQALLERQRAFRESPGLVTDGRDMGTVVFPDAEIKVFLTASAEQRAIRRYNQLKGIGIHANLSGLVVELRERDKRDQERAISPLKPAADALLIDTDLLTIDEVVERIMIKVRKVFSIAG